MARKAGLVAEQRHLPAAGFKGTELGERLLRCTSY
jgi:hypothetical protein